ncbi:MAG: hypothetical protein EA388_10695 [Nitriliruptor sp.]|nr:MAG: hypothetical protein EA388_10695 [Nitriliruptor sp.]
MTNNEMDTTTDEPTTEAPARSGIELPDWLTHPAMCAAAVLILAPALFLLGRQVGITLYAATDGEPGSLIVFVGVAVLMALVAVGAWVDTRRKRRGD